MRPKDVCGGSRPAYGLQRLQVAALGRCEGIDTMRVDLGAFQYIEHEQLEQRWHLRLQPRNRGPVRESEEVVQQYWKVAAKAISCTFAWTF
jgi:hypothetical protein